MIDLKVVQENDKILLYNLLQKYLYEMTKYYYDDIDENGNYEYRYFEDYFTDNSRKAFFIMKDEHIAGFVMLNQYSYIEETTDYVLAEFCILPKYRRLHIAKEAFEMLCKIYSGKWEIKYCVKNIPAMQVWNQVTEQYNPIVHQLSEDERVIVFCTN